MSNPLPKAEQTSSQTPSVDASIAISDPGERRRDEHYSIDRFVIWLGNVVAWIFPILIVAIVSQVIMRKMGTIRHG